MSGEPKPVAGSVCTAFDLAGDAPGVVMVTEDGRVSVPIRVTPVVTVSRPPVAVFGRAGETVVVPWEVR